MKKFLILTLICCNIQTVFAQENKEYGKGTIVWSAFDLKKQEIAGNGEGEKMGDITKVVKFIKNGAVMGYAIFFIQKKESEKTVIKLYKDSTGELGAEFINYDNGNEYLVNDLLETKKYLGLLSKKELPNVSNKYRMLLQIFIN